MSSILLENLVDSLQAQGRYSFSYDEIASGSKKSDQAIKKFLQRAVKSGRLIRPKRKFYVIVPLEYRAAGAPPVSWFIHDLMAASKQPYYVGLLSAAGLHGATHQQPQTFQVLADKPMRPIMAGRVRITFYVSKYIYQTRTVDMKTPTGYMQVSGAETTVVDLLRFVKVAGHLDHVSFVIDQLSGLLVSKNLLAELNRLEDVPNAQRLGYIFDTLGKPKLSDSVYGWVKKRAKRYQLLRPGKSANNSCKNLRWHLLINEPLEIDN